MIELLKSIGMLLGFSMFMVAFFMVGCIIIDKSCGWVYKKIGKYEDSIYAIGMILWVIIWLILMEVCK